MKKTRNSSLYDLSHQSVAEGGCTRRVSLMKLRLQSFIFENKNIREEFVEFRKHWNQAQRKG